jgi:transposase-like protein
MLHQTGQARLRVINLDGHPAYATAIAELKQSGELGRRGRLEQDHRFIKKRITASLWFRSVGGALNTIAGYESMHIIRKGQVRWLPKGDVVGQIRFIHQVYGIAA